MNREQQFQLPAAPPQRLQTSSAPPPLPTAQTEAPVKKKRNQAGNSYPDAEVIALSPKSLLATNRFVCEVCNKGFQREQNLQLHRRGHNLPWKLRQKSAGEVRRRVYLCPEPTCVHHDPSRALGDLTGIKKHFCRKHGEKKWKCDKCSKRYAVQSDWKAHSKTCGTREYRCDCGTLFSRRDSFVTHRAFCDALAQESVRLPSGLNTLGSQIYRSSSIGLGLSQLRSPFISLQDQGNRPTGLLRLGGAGGTPQLDHIISPSSSSSFRSPHPMHPSSSAFYPGSSSSQDFNEPHDYVLQSKPFNGLMQLPELHLQGNNSDTTSASAVAAAANVFNLGYFSNGNDASSMHTSNNGSSQSNHLLVTDQLNNVNGSMDPSSTHFSRNILSDHTGFTSLYDSSIHNDPELSRMSATLLLQKAVQMGATTSGEGPPLLGDFGNSTSGGANAFRTQLDGGGTNIHDLMNSLADGGTATSSSGLFQGHEQANRELSAFNAKFCNMDETKFNLSGAGNHGASDGLTRDFLGVGSMVRSLQAGGISPRQHHGIDMSSFGMTEMKAASSGQRFAGGSL